VDLLDLILMFIIVPPVMFILFEGVGPLLNLGALIIGTWVGYRVLAGLYAHYNSPEKVWKREDRKRMGIQAELFKQKQIEAEERIHQKREARRKLSRERELRVEEECSALYKSIRSKERERNNLSAQMTNLYNVAKSVEDGKAGRAEANRIHNEIAGLKAKKIRLSEEIDDLHLQIKRTRAIEEQGGKGDLPFFRWWRAGS